MSKMKLDGLSLFKLMIKRLSIIFIMRLLILLSSFLQKNTNQINMIKMYTHELKMMY